MAPTNVDIIEAKEVYIQLSFGRYKGNLVLLHYYIKKFQETKIVPKYIANQQITNIAQLII